MYYVESDGLDAVEMIDHTPNKAVSLLKEGLDDLERDGQKVVRPDLDTNGMGYDTARLVFPTDEEEKIRREIIVEPIVQLVSHTNDKTNGNVNRGNSYIIRARARRHTAGIMMGREEVFGSVDGSTKLVDYKKQLVDAYRVVNSWKSPDLVKLKISS